MSCPLLIGKMCSRRLFGDKVSLVGDVISRRRLLRIPVAKAGDDVLQRRSPDASKTDIKMDDYDDETQARVRIRRERMKAPFVGLESRLYFSDRALELDICVISDPAGRRGK